jgi:hypothetical protein
MDKKIQQPLTRDGTITIDIKLLEHIDDLNSETFIKQYKISNLWRGKYFIKRLINKIFKYQLYQKMKWNNSFWDRIKISRISTQIHDKDLKKVQLNIQKKTETGRYSDIKKYQELIIEGFDLGNPLYISGNCLKYLGATIESNNIYILDGSRRLIANINNNLSPQILLIELND